MNDFFSVDEIAGDDVAQELWVHVCVPAALSSGCSAHTWGILRSCRSRERNRLNQRI